MSMSFNIGDLVYDPGETNFTGIGKLESIDEIEGVGIVGFFSSPQKSFDRAIKVNLQSLELAELFDEQNVYLIDKHFNIWRRARYGGARPCGNHLVIFTKNKDGSYDDSVLPISELYVLNLLATDIIDPGSFLKNRCVDAPFFYNCRRSFVETYIEQRAACRSISAIPSSSIELEPHQLAVVSRVLADHTKKYLLADEVGLGKTIEAALILKELLLKDYYNKKAIASVPEGLVSQWENELTNRFHLSDLFGKSLLVCGHDDLSQVLKKTQVDILVIDEVHQIAPWAWSADNALKDRYKEIALACHQSKSCLLLSGTPLNGNEVNFLAMLHLLTPDSYRLTEDGLVDFQNKMAERDRLGQIYQAMVASNDNGTLTENIDRVMAIFPNDESFKQLANQAAPLLDWMASEESDERTDMIKRVRRYMGENYRLHQRQLRNRRTDASIANLFPGLAGVEVRHWAVNSAYSTEQLLEVFRTEFIIQDLPTLAIRADNFRAWLHDLFISPMRVMSRAKTDLHTFFDRLSSGEKEALETIVDHSQREQNAKDLCLIQALDEWLCSNAAGQCVVFCTDPDVADYVAEYLQNNLKYQVERHLVDLEPRFIIDKTYRVLVCDERGEDGLNLNGGTKLLLHYSLPLSLARIEQRIGRVNRYSAHIFAAPVQNMVLLSEVESYSAKWHGILSEAVGIYSQSIASLQYVLEDPIESALDKLVDTGLDGLETLHATFAGHSGLVSREKQIVVTQELLNNMDEEIEEARGFVRQVADADERAEEQQNLMLNWITKALMFKKVNGEVPGTFRFKYQSESDHGQRTFLDVQTFVERCVAGIDFDKSDGAAVVTNMMSADRQLVSHGRKVYPFRFGQPFVDVIYDEMQSDTRGICTASYRQHKIKGLAGISAFFKIDYLLTAKPASDNLADRRIADNRLPPKMVSNWFKESGELVGNEVFCQYLDKKEEYDEQIRGEHWEALEEDYSAQYWRETVERVTLGSETNLHQLDIHSDYVTRMLSIKVLFLVSM